MNGSLCNDLSLKIKHTPLNFLIATWAILDTRRYLLSMTPTVIYTHFHTLTFEKQFIISIYIHDI